MINTIRLSNKSSVYLETKKRKKIKRSDIFRDDQRVAIIHKYRPEASTLRYWWHAFIRVTCQGVSVSFFPSLSLSLSLYLLFLSCIFQVFFLSLVFFQTGSFSVSSLFRKYQQCRRRRRRRLFSQWPIHSFIGRGEDGKEKITTDRRQLSPPKLSMDQFYSTISIGRLIQFECNRNISSNWFRKF